MGEFSRYPNPHPSLKASQHHPFCVTLVGPWVEGGGWTRGCEKLYLIVTIIFINNESMQLSSKIPLIEQETGDNLSKF